MTRLAFVAFAATLALASCQQNSIENEFGKQAEQERTKADAFVGAQASFLEENKKKPGVTTTASGLQWERVVAGDATLASPGPSDNVLVDYEGTLTDGTVFDSSYKRGQPAGFGVSEVIPGWTEALQLMKPGDEFRVVIPADIGYGSDGSPPDIPGGATLVFKVQLHAFRKADGTIVGTPPKL